LSYLKDENGDSFVITILRVKRKLQATPV